MLRNTQIIAVVDMDRDLFQPKNDTQTSMVLMRRLSRDERELAAKGKLDYPVFMAVTHKIGHDKRGKIIYRRTETGEDLLVLRTEESVVTDIKTGEERIVKLQIKVNAGKNRIGHRSSFNTARRQCGDSAVRARTVG
jgi:type I restriction enzyme M protein